MTHLTDLLLISQELNTSLRVSAIKELYYAMYWNTTENSPSEYEYQLNNLCELPQELLIKLFDINYELIEQTHRKTGFELGHYSPAFELIWKGRIDDEGI